MRRSRCEEGGRCATSDGHRDVESGGLDLGDGAGSDSSVPPDPKEGGGAVGGH